MMNSKDLTASVKKLQKERNAIILAHVYQRGEIQDIADFVGDSLDLSRKAVSTNADVIVFCGVQFMAETAAILNPQKTILLPYKQAGCGLADMATGKQVMEIKKQHSDVQIVSYVNSSADVKAVSDICCTSANAIDVVNALSGNKIFFIPDKNLGSYVAEQTRKKILLWDGYCYVHENIRASKLEELKHIHPDAKIIVHPECTDEVRHMADFTGSTSQMSIFVKKSSHKEFIVGTEDNFVYRLKSDNPDKRFYKVNTLCEGMNTITLERVRNALENMEFIVTVPTDIREKEKKALDKMLTI
jgi:quinolinate synthase